MPEFESVGQLREDFRVAMVRAIRGRADPEESRRAINELLPITYRLDARLRATGDPAYVRAVQSDRVGETIVALADVRAASEHRSLLAFARYALAPSPSLAPSPHLAPGGNLQWHPTAEVGEHLLNPRRGTGEGARAKAAMMLARYERRLAGFTVLQTFDVAWITFQSVLDQ